MTTSIIMDFTSGYFLFFTCLHMIPGHLPFEFPTELKLFLSLFPVLNNVVSSHCVTGFFSALTSHEEVGHYLKSSLTTKWSYSQTEPPVCSCSAPRIVSSALRLLFTIHNPNVLLLDSAVIFGS